MDFKEIDANEFDADTDEKFSKSFDEIDAQFEKAEKDCVLKVATKAFLFGLKLGYEYSKTDWLDIFCAKD